MWQGCTKEVRIVEGMCVKDKAFNGFVFNIGLDPTRFNTLLK